MASNVNSNTFSTTYKDDFIDSDNYHRILFNAGRALQARELTQMQTIIQEELARFGRNVFKDGANVNPGGVTVNNAFEFVKVQADIDSDFALFDSDGSGNRGTGLLLTGGTSNIGARVLDFVNAEGSDPATIFVQYIDTKDATTPDTEPKRFIAGEALTGSLFTGAVQTTDTIADPATGQGTRLSFDKGDFFVRNHFVQANSQSIILEKYSNTATKEVGFKLKEEIITVSDDTALYDNQGTSPNTTAPGADRYRISLTLIDKALLDPADSFVYLCDVENGFVVDQVTGTDDYNKINELLATRTKEESGDYIVNNFSLDYDTDSASATSLRANVSRGLAYLNGYRAEAPASTVLTITKPTTTETIGNQTIGIDYGNFFNVSSGNLTGKFGVDNYDTVHLIDSATVGGTPASDPGKIGTARVRQVSRNGTDFKIHLFDIAMTGSNQVRSIRSIAGDTSNDLAIIDLVGGQAQLNEAGKRAALFPLPKTRPDETGGFSDITFDVQQLFTETAVGTVVTLNTGDANNTFVNTNEWIVVKNTDGSIEANSGLTFGSTGSTSITISGVSGSGASYSVYARVRKVSAAGVVPSQTRIKTKTLTQVDSSYDMSTELRTSGSVSYLDLTKTDIFSLEYVRQDSANGTDITNRFFLDNGQKHAFYDKGRAVLTKNVTAPTGTVHVRFKHFAHSTDGDFFCAQSYAGQVDYSAIPSFDFGNRSKLPLRDVLDFRSSVGIDGEFDGTGAVTMEMPDDGAVFQADISYYLPRADRIVIQETGRIKNIEGEPAFNPQIPEKPKNTLTLFETKLGANTLDEKYVTTTPLRYNRYTMADIGELAERIDVLEEMTTLSMLEAETSTLLVLDSDGLPRTKAGFFADNFRNKGFTDLQDGNHRAAINPAAGYMTTREAVTNRALFFDSSDARNTGVVLKGDNIYLAHNHVVAISQDLMSGTENINPFAVITNEGHLTLSPTSDIWHSEVITPGKVTTNPDDITITSDVYEGTLERGTASARRYDQEYGQITLTSLNGVPTMSSADYRAKVEALGGTDFLSGYVGNHYGYNWHGTNIYSKEFYYKLVAAGGTSTGGGAGSIHRNTRTYKAIKVLSSDVIKETIGERRVETIFKEHMRARMIYFKAQGLIPETQYFAFFDNKSVADFVRGGTAAPAEEFKRLKDNEYNNDWERYRNNSAHPDGATTLTTDGNGLLEGSFWLPETSTINFKSGDKEFKLLNANTTDDNGTTSRASATFTSSGEITQIQEADVVSTRKTELSIREWTEEESFRVASTNFKSCYIDPLAQTFLVEPENGMYLTKVDVFFKTKDDTVPVQMQIRPVVNGHPSSNQIVPGAVKFLNPSEVTAFDDVGSTENLANVQGQATTFEFDEPVFLNPGSEYAIVLLADSIDYNVYVAETYALQLGSTSKRVNRQPYLGSLFKSQNGTTWEPDQAKDLAFKLYRANFTSTSGSAYLTNYDAPQVPAILYTDSAVSANDSDVGVWLPNHGFHIGEQVVISGLDSATRYNGILGSSIVGTRTVTAADGNAFLIGADSSFNASSPLGGTTFAERQVQFSTLTPYITSLIPDNTNIITSLKTTSGKSIAGGETKFQKDAAFSTNIIVNEVNEFDRVNVIATSRNETANLSGAKSLEFKLDLSTVNNQVSPVIDLQRVGVYAGINIIDNPDSDISSVGTISTGRTVGVLTGAANKPLRQTSETDPYDGTGLAKHITTPVGLENPAKGLKIIAGALRPASADFDVYWRTATDGVNIFDQDWTYVSASTFPAADENNYREYRWIVGGDTGTMNPFTIYQVKIVMRSNNAAKVPIFKDLRVIALVT